MYLEFQIYPAAGSVGDVLLLRISPGTPGSSKVTQCFQSCSAVCFPHWRAVSALHPQQGSAYTRGRGCASAVCRMEAECFNAPWHVGILQTCLWDCYGWCLTLECKDQTATNTSWAILLKRRVLGSWWDLRQVNLLILDTHTLSGEEGSWISVAVARPLPQGSIQQTASPV